MLLEAAAATNASSLLSTIDWSRPTWDLFIYLFFVVAAFLYGLSLGRDRIVVILVSIYMSLAIVQNAPYLRDPGFQQQLSESLNRFFVFQISAFLAIFIILFFLLSRSALLKSFATSDSSGPWWQVLLFSILHVGLIVSITLSFLPPAAAEKLSPITRQIFTGEMGRFIWIVAPVVAMILFKGGGGDKKKFKYEI